MKILLYKGPATGFWRKVAHWLICIRTLSLYSHAELMIGHLSYSSSWMDGGVRAKFIEPDGHWDIITLEANKAQYDIALDWFLKHKSAGYDWRGVVRFLLPFVRQRKNQFFCFEAVLAMLEVNYNGDKPTANDIIDYVVMNYRVVEK